MSAAADLTGRSMTLLRRVEASARARARSRAWAIFEAAKPAVQAMRRQGPAAHVFIFGCQRSGTTHLERLFRSDPRSTVYGEFSALSVAPDRTAWRPLGEVAQALRSSRGAYTVARSLLGSDLARAALDSVSPSAAVWMFRDPDGVVASMIRKWGPDFRAISQRVETGRDGAWSLRPLWDEIEAAAGELSEPGSGQWLRDVYGLFWLRRNRLAFDAGLVADPRVRVVDYAELVARPQAVVAGILAQAGIAAPRLAFPQATSTASLRPGRHVGLSAPVAAECARLLGELKRAAAPR